MLVVVKEAKASRCSWWIANRFECEGDGRPPTLSLTTYDWGWRSRRKGGSRQASVGKRASHSAEPRAPA